MITKARRIVISKELREKLGWTEGTMHARCSFNSKGECVKSLRAHLQLMESKT